MEQLLPICSRFAKTGATLLALILTGHTIQAQSGSTDTLRMYQAEEISRGIPSDSSKYYHQKKDQLNKGLITSPEQLLAGNIEGLQVMATSGQPGAPFILRQHAVYTAFGERDPLILLDGLPIENQSPSDNTGYLIFINPEDIASITFMDGAASVAVYGGRAANGVLAITSKRAGKGERTKVTYSSTAAISQLRKKADVLTADEFRTLVQENYPEKVGLLGDHSTDWQDEIYRNAFSHNQHISLSGTVFKSVPYRVSAGYLNENGILKTARNTRKTLDLSLNPSLLQNHLTMDLNFRAAGQEINVADKRAVTAAWAFDPTQPVYQENNYGGYYTYMDENGEPAADAPLNPLSMLEQRRALDKTNSIMAQAHLKYVFPFLPTLNLHVRYGLLNTSNGYDVSSAANMAAIKSNYYYYSKFKVDNEIKNKTSHKEAYITYKHPREILQSSINLMAGVALNNLESESDRNSESYGGTEVNRSRYLFGRENKSVFSSLTLNHKDRFLFETAFSNTNYSNLASGTAAATYSFGSTWNVMKEKFMKENQVFSSLKLQASYLSFAGSPQMRFPENTIISPSFSPERMKTLKIGTGFGVLQEKIKGDISFFRYSQDGSLILAAPVFQGRYITTENSLTARGVKGSIQYQARYTSNLTVTLVPMLVTKRMR